jgi:hypothetical protein
VRIKQTNVIKDVMIYQMEEELFVRVIQVINIIKNHLNVMILMNVKIQRRIIVHRYVLTQKVLFDVNVQLVLNQVE